MRKKTRKIKKRKEANNAKKPKLSKKTKTAEVVGVDSNVKITQKTETKKAP